MAWRRIKHDPVFADMDPLNHRPWDYCRMENYPVCHKDTCPSPPVHLYSRYSLFSPAPYRILSFL